MKLLFDLDIFLYKICYTPKDFIQQIETLEGWVESICFRLNSSDRELILSGSSNFRYDISKDYKANRKKEKPRYFQDLRNYAINELGATVAIGEADDYIGCKHNKNTIIVSTDKDMMQLGGKIYNFVKDELVDIDWDSSIYYFWTQCLTGDTADNVITLPGIGPKKAEKILADGNWREAVVNTYKKFYGDQWFEKFDTTARLLWLKRDPNKEYYDYV